MIPFLEDSKDVFKAISVVLSIITVTWGYFNAKAKYPVFHYQEHSSANYDSWRWRKPDKALALKVEDDAQKSCLLIPEHLLFQEKACIVVGYFGALFTLYLYGLLVYRDVGFPEYLMSLLFVMLSWALLNVGGRITSLTLSPDKLVLEEHYAFFLKRITVYQSKMKLNFKGKIQSIFELSTDSKNNEPEFNLTIQRRYGFIFATKKRWVLAINQSQGSWLVEGLEAWYLNQGLSEKNK